jgi:hypothetical protein
MNEGAKEREVKERMETGSLRPHTLVAEGLTH